MKPGVKLAAFALVLAAAFGGGAAMGAVFEPDQQAPAPMDHDMNNMSEMDHANMTTTTAPAP